MNNLQLEISTMKIMIFSLHNAINDLCKSLTGKEITKLEKWEKECEEIAQIYLKKEESESEE